jgi:drug/metabolite transporter (DMT)-like permease
MCGALACFTGLDASAKWAMAEGAPALQTVWARYAGAIVLSLAAAAPRQWGAVVRSMRPSGQILRSCLLFAATVTNFFALRSLQLSETISIQFSMPLIVALAAGPLLGEWVGARRLAAIVVGFLGVLIVARPDASGLKPAVALSLLNAFCYAGYMLATRAMAKVDSPRTALFWSSLVGAAALTPVLPFVWRAPETLGQLAALGAVAGLGTVGHWLLILAHRRAPAATLAPFIYVQLLFMIAAGWLVFGDAPGPHTLMGGAVVIASGLYLLARERRPG